ncbi:adenosylcobinamide amidohydrolase [soil metagenome]
MVSIDPQRPTSTPSRPTSTPSQRRRESTAPPVPLLLLVTAPELLPPTPLHRGVLVWRWTSPMVVLTSAAVRGGLTECTSLINFGVALDYARIDLETHADEIAAELGLRDTPPALLTAADVSAYGTGRSDGVLASATVGVTKPTWAADPDGGWSPYTPGTINVVVQVPVPLSAAGLVGAVMTVTEAKTQALIEHCVPGTGTASDAVAIACPRGDLWPDVGAESGQEMGPEVGNEALPDATSSGEVFAGPRSPWGSRMAIATHTAISNGLRGHAGAPA